MPQRGCSREKRCALAGSAPSPPRSRRSSCARRRGTRTRAAGREPARAAACSRGRSRSRTSPSTTQNRTERAELVLDQARQADRHRKNSTIATAIADHHVRRSTSPREISALSSSSSALLGRQLGVGGDLESLEADRHRAPERDDSAHDRQPQEAVAPHRRFEREGAYRDLAARALLGEARPRSAARAWACAPPPPSWRRLASSRPRARPGRPPGRRAGRLSSPPAPSVAAPDARGAARTSASATRRRRLGLRACACRRPLATRRWKRSTRPPVSISFCLPV